MTHTFRRLAAAATLIMAAAAAHADPVIDGRFDPGEGYSTGQYLNFVLDDGTFVSGGQVWSFVAANGDVSLAFIQPTSINDNSFGTTRIGWGSRNHNLSDLKGSDKAQIQMTNGAGSTVLDFTLDYLNFTTGGGYFDGGVTSGDGKMTLGSAANILAHGTSINYDLNLLPGGSAYTTNSPAADPDYGNPALAGWVYDIVYEVEVSHLAFGTSGFGDFTIVSAHDSPNKFGARPPVTVVVDGDIPSSNVPEPATLAALAFGLLALGVLRRRRKH